MTDLEFEDRDAAIHLLRARLNVAPRADAASSEELNACLLEFVHPAQQSPLSVSARPQHGHYLKGLRWAVHNDDLRLIDLVAEALKAAVAILPWQGIGPGAWNASLTSLLLVLFKIFDTVRKKRIVLSETEERIIIILAPYPGGLELGTLVYILQQVEVAATAETVRAALDGLQSKWTADGSRRALVADLGGDLWRVGGV